MRWLTLFIETPPDMTQVGVGGVTMGRWQRTERFQRDFRKLDAEMQDKVRAKLKDLLKNPRPAGLRFEKLKGYSNPDIYTIHITGNYKLSFLVHGAIALLRRVAPHDEIDRAP